MKKTLSITFIGLCIIGLIALLRFHPASTAKNTSRGVPLTTMSSATDPTTSAVPASYKDGTYTGQTVDVDYGNVQVAAVVAGGKITDVTFLQMPDTEGRSTQVTQMARPVLLQETLSAQSANVDAVSGATSTSEGYIQSLKNALSQAS